MSFESFNTGDAFTLVTREDDEMVRAVEARLKTRIERRTLDGFDYNAPAPARDTEFARPSRPQSPRRQAQSASGKGNRIPDGHPLTEPMVKPVTKQRCGKG